MTSLPTTSKAEPQPASQPQSPPQSQPQPQPEPPGATPGPEGTRFRIWAPGAGRLDIVLEPEGAAHALAAAGDGWFEGVVTEARPGSRYRLRLDGAASYPDPWSRSQPDGVHGASEVVDQAEFAWTDHAWPGIRREDLVILELHVGTATERGTFDALMERLPYFAELGVTALELMPVAEFPGVRNWGYDGVSLFAPASAYGGPAGLKRFVDAAHGHGLAVLLDVVYNHFGPEGNYLPAVTGGRVFTERHHTPWGAAVNYDDEGSDAVRETVLANVRQWIGDYHIDGLRLDATHAIYDDSPTHILQLIGEAARAAAGGRDVVVIAEDERNERRLIMPAGDGGYGLDCVWADDAHHSLRRLVAGDAEGYYAAYRGTAAELARTLAGGWLYQGEYYEPTGHRRGTKSDGLEPHSFVHCIQNHDQVGNRALGERLNHHVPPNVYRAASALLLLTPYTPLLWMGQEWAASTPFLYFTDHPDELGRQVTEGRRQEFSGFSAFADPAVRERIPDPQHESTFRRSKLNWSEREDASHAGVATLYRELLALRRSHPALLERARTSWAVQAHGEATLTWLRRAGNIELLLVVHLHGSHVLEMPGDGWKLLLHSESTRFAGAGIGPGRDAAGLLLLDSPMAVLLERIAPESPAG